MNSNEYAAVLSGLLHEFDKRYLRLEPSKGMTSLERAQKNFNSKPPSMKLKFPESWDLVVELEKGQCITGFGNILGNILKINIF